MAPPPPPPRITVSFNDDARAKLHWYNGDLRSHSRSSQVSARSFLVAIVAFFLLLLLTLLCLYIRRACRYRRMVITVSSSTDHATPLDSAAGLDGEAIEGIPVVLHVGGDDTPCSICLTSFEDGKKVKVLPVCGHHFHPCCVDEWLRSHPSCPLCRTVLEPNAGGGSAQVEVVV